MQIDGIVRRSMDRDDDAEVEIVCPNCGYRTRRLASRLRRTTPVVCAQCGTVVVEGDAEEDERRK
jgi:DNA-directed RNA polymerase subunit RPC12/RpoP